MVQVQVLGLAMDVTQDPTSPVIMLKEVNGTSVLPIWVGPAEATAIAVQLESKEMSRPLTHDLLKTVIEGMGGEVVKVIVTDLQEDTFYARIFIKHQNELFSIDARPSDSVALALRTDSPIYVHKDVSMDLDISQFQKMEIEDDKEESGASDIQEYLSNLEPEDFGKIDPDD